MDDAATVFATACAVIAASTGMVLCMAPKSVNDAVIDEEAITKEEKAADAEEEEEEAVATTTDEAMKQESCPEPVPVDEQVVSEEPVDTAPVTVTTEAVPEQRPDESSSPMKKKRRFTLRGDRVSAKPEMKKTRSMKWSPFRPKNKKNDAANVGQEV